MRTIDINTRKIVKAFVIVAMIFGFAACSKKSNDRTGIYRPNGDRTVITNDNCPNCPLQTNLYAEALGSTGPGAVNIEMGIAFYADTQAISGSIVNPGGAITAQGYMAVLSDNSITCNLLVGDYEVQTVAPGQLDYVGNFQNLQLVARHLQTNQSVSMVFQWVGYSPMSPAMISKVDNQQYTSALNGSLLIQNIEGVSGPCSTYPKLFGKPF